MKKRWFRVLVILILFILLPCVKADAKETKEDRLLLMYSDIYINEKSIIEVTYSNRVDGEELEVKTSDKTVVKVKLGKWDDSKKYIILTPQKEGTATVTVVAPDNEKKEIVVHVSEKKQLSTQELYRKCISGVVEVVTTDSVNSINIGSGFFINGNMVVTNYHVIDCASNIKIRDYMGNMYEVDTIYDYNKNFDLAVLGIKNTAPSTLICNFSKVETGENVYAIGSPLSLSGSISEGIVSKAYRDREGVIYHQNTASIAQNSGGGPLLNIYGEVIAINTSRIIGAQNINFALDINYLKQLNYINKAPIQELYQENAGKIKVNTIYITLP
ncbi:MAG: trypsin-like peptidase domain-containing protein [Clostridiales bacterium]|nr:trypsin-like peptidase domain-containing protein [Clostridiales bacterium]